MRKEFSRLTIPAALCATFIIATPSLGSAQKALATGESGDNYLARLNELKGAENILRTELERRKASTLEQRKKVADLKAKMEKDEVQFQESGGGKYIGGIQLRSMSGIGNDRLKEAFATSKAEYEKEAAQLDVLEKDTAEHNKSLSKLSSEVQKMESTTKSEAFKNKVLNERVEGLALANEVQALKATSGDVEKAINEIERKFSDQAIALYMRDKVGKLLNSQMICKLRSRCDTKEPVEITPEQINEIFPEMTAPQRSGYHPKIKKETVAQ